MRAVSLLLGFALLLAAAAAFDKVHLRGLQSGDGDDKAAWAGEINRQIINLRQAQVSQNLAPITEHKALVNSSAAAAKTYAKTAFAGELTRDNDRALQLAKDAGYEGVGVTEYVAKVNCTGAAATECVQQLMKMWGRDPSGPFTVGGGAFDPAVTHLGTSVASAAGPQKAKDAADPVDISRDLVVVVSHFGRVA